MIELKHLETYSNERISDACLACADFAFDASVFTPLGDYCSPALQKRAGSAYTTSRQAKICVQPHQVVAKRPAS